MERTVGIVVGAIMMTAGVLMAGSGAGYFIAGCMLSLVGGLLIGLNVGSN